MFSSSNSSLIDLIAPEQRGVARIGDLHLAQHLAHDDLDVLVVNLDALEPVNFLHFVHQVFLQILRPADFENFVRHNRTFGQLLTFLHEVALEDDDVFGQRNQMLLFCTGLRILQDQSCACRGPSRPFRQRHRSSRSRPHLSDAALRKVPPRAADRR